MHELPWAGSLGPGMGIVGEQDTIVQKFELAFESDFALFSQA